MEQTKPFKIWDKMGYIFGRSVFVSVNNMFIPVYMLYFFTEVFGLNIAAAGAMTALVRIIGSASQIFASYLIDHTHSKRGQARPFLLLGIPVAILVFLLYYVPDLAGGLKTAYAYIVYTLFTVSSAFYGAANALMLPRMTDNSAERHKISSVYGVSLGILSFILTVWCVPIVTVLGGGNIAVGFTAFAGIIGGLIFISTLFSYRVKEQVSVTPQKVNLLEDTKAILKNKYGLLYAAGTLLFTTGINLVGALIAYVASYLIGSPGSIAIIYACVFAVYPILSALYVPILKRINKAQMLMIFSGLTIIGCVIRMIFPTSLVVCIIGLCLMVLVDNTLMCYSGLIVSEATDSVELKHGVRSESTFYSVFALVSSLIYSGILTLATHHLDAAGYINNAQTQVPAALNALSFWVTVPLLVASVVCIIFMVPLSRYAKEYPGIKEMLIQKRASEKQSQEAAQ